MSDQIDLSTLPTASTVSNTDTLLLLSDGSLKAATPTVLDNRNRMIFSWPGTLSEAWVRIGYVGGEGSFLLAVTGFWGVATTQLVLLAGQAHMSGNDNLSRVQNLLTTTNADRFTKARLVRTSSSRVYLDIFASKKYSRIAVSPISTYAFTQTEPTVVESLEEGETAYEFSLSGGG